MDNNLNQQPQVVYVQQPVYVQPQQTEKKPGKGLALSIIGMVLGINALLYFICLVLYFFLCTVLPAYFYQFSSSLEEVFYSGGNYTTFIVLLEYWIFAIVSAVIGLILSAKGRKLIHSKMAGAGIVLSIIALIITALFTAFAVVTAIA